MLKKRSDITISFVIPCYNHGAFLQDALESLPARAEIPYEVIIVNDGSTDPFTLAKLDDLEKKGYTVLSHANKGLGYSRNAGIAYACGKYIMPLDADNKIIWPGVVESIRLMEKLELDVVYGKPVFFGEDIPSRRFVPKPFNGDELFIGNYIDACCVFRRSVWDQLGGYDEKMPYQGNEDWEFWIRAYLGGFKFFYLEKYCYEYRIAADSMLGSIINNEKRYLNHQYITNKHHREHIAAFARNFTFSTIYLSDTAHPARSVFKYLYHIFKPFRQ